MQKVIDSKGTKVTVFETYIIGEASACPECNRQFKESDIKRIEEASKTGGGAPHYPNTFGCPACGARLKRK